MSHGGGDGSAIEYDLAARAAIATNLALHSRGVDRNDVALLSSAYHPDATVAYGMFEGPAHEFARSLTGAMAGAPTTLHRTSNMFIRVEGDRARSESYAIAYMRSIDGETSHQRLIGGRYLDRHERRDGDWRIAHRIYVMDWNANVPRREPAALPSVRRGAQGDGDPAHALFAAHRREILEKELSMATGSVEDAVAKQALHDLVTIYARAIDRADEALMASAFHPDAEVVTGIIDGKAPDYARDITASVRATLKSTFHSIANEYFEVSGHVAAGETYILAHMIAAGDAPEETLIGGRYLDRFEKRDGTWKIAHRTYVQDWSMSQPVTMEDGGPYETLLLRGGYAPNDPAIDFWDAARA